MLLFSLLFSQTAIKSFQSSRFAAIMQQVEHGFLSLIIVAYVTVLAKALSTHEVSFSVENLDLPAVYHALDVELRMSDLPPAPSSSFDLSSHTPFCENRTSAAPLTPLQSGGATECVRWEEQELDMLLMYMDLIAVGMEQSLAQQFYRQVRCLSRKNVVADARTMTWNVCFSYDFSEHVGTLLAHYIKQDFKLHPPVKTPMPSSEPGNTLRMINSSNHFLFPYATVAPDNRGLFLLFAFGDAEAFRVFSSVESYEQQRQTSCCVSCSDDNYFVNIEQDQCVLNPFGAYCCHKACKSLDRLRVGVSTSVGYCCKECNPKPCQT